MKLQPDQKSAPDAVAILTAEIANYETQFTEAQQQVANWNSKMLMASGAGQACKAVLARLQSPPTTQETTPAA